MSDQQQQRPDWVKQDQAGNEIDTRPVYKGPRKLKVSHPGCRVKEERIAANLTKQELADAVDITRESMHNYENGGTIPLHVARKIALKLGKTMAHLWPA